MIGKIFGAFVGNQASKHVKGISGTSGALLGIAVPVVMRRVGPLGVIVAAAGAYAFKKRSDRRNVDNSKSIHSSSFTGHTRKQA